MGRTGAQVSVLVVEDEILISSLVADALSASGFVVHEATTADGAQRYIDSDADMDVPFTDINLPRRYERRGVGGARELRPEMPIVYASGRFKLSEIAPLVPRSLFMAKPYDPSDVCTLLTRFTDSSSLA